MKGKDNTITVYEYLKMVEDTKQTDPIKALKQGLNEYLQKIEEKDESNANILDLLLS